MSMRVDKFYERRIVWDKLLADPDSEAFGHLSYEAIRAVSSSLQLLIYFLKRSNYKFQTFRFAD